VQCTVCDLFQKTDETLVADYLNYHVFDDNPSADKLIFRTGQPHRTRSQFVAELLVSKLAANHRKRVLEVGCQRGAFLAALKALAPSFELHGFDLDPSYKNLIEPICGPGSYHSGELADVQGPFDACVLIHTLEHIPYPGRVLDVIHRLLAPGGLLVIVVPDVLASPLDFYVIDHTCHFVAPVLERTLLRSRFVGTPATDLISNEQIALARSAERVEMPTTPLESSEGPILSLLHRLESCLQKLPKGPSLVFGTAVIGVLISSVLGDDCIAFVDESPFQIGKEFLGRKIRSTADLCGERVILGVAESLAPAAAERLRQLGADAVNPWEFSDR
jgi:SAM-dependent methyltransferase